MNIANIFGLHIGCIVKAYNYKYKLYSVNKEGFCYLDNVKTAEREFAKIKDCKLLLKPLSAISEEDKAGFVKRFVIVTGLLEKINMEFFNCNEMFVFVKTTTGYSKSEQRRPSTEQLLWLATMGYDIGIVPDEYKEVVE